MTHTISPMSINDYDEVLALWQHTDGVGLDLDDADSRENINLYLQRNPGMSFIARAGSQLIGAVLCGHDGRRGFLHHLAVDPAFRKQGLGHLLVEHCLGALRNCGITRCYIMVFADNAAGQCFWNNAGWHAREDLLLMQAVTKDNLH